MQDKLELARSTDEEKQNQLKRLAEFHRQHAAESPAMLKRLQQAVIANGNVFDVLMDAVRCCSLGQITNALFEVGGQYRRSMYCSPQGSIKIPIARYSAVCLQRFAIVQLAFGPVLVLKVLAHRAICQSVAQTWH